MTDTKKTGGTDADHSSEPKQGTGEQEKEHHSGMLEKLFTVMSLLLLLGVASFLVWQWISGSTPPAFKIEAEAPHKRGDFTNIEVTVENTGNETAKSVQVMAEATGADGKPVDSQATLDWLPGNSKRTVSLVFPLDTDTSGAVVRVAGYEQP